MAEGARFALERSERGSALAGSMAVVEQEEGHQTSIASGTLRNIGVAP